MSLRLPDFVPPLNGYVFDGLSVDELEQAFQTVIEQYLTDCQTLNKIPTPPTYSFDEATTTVIN
jgi:predicted RNase H-like HicB family nuclease